MLQGIAKWASKHADFIHFIIFHSVYQNDVSINNNSIQTTIIFTDNFHDSIAGNLPTIFILYFECVILFQNT